MNGQWICKVLFHELANVIINNHSLYSVQGLLIQHPIQNAHQVSEFSSGLMVLSRHILSVDRHKMGEML